MRAMAYVIAALAAVGIMIGIAMMPENTNAPTVDPDAAEASVASASPSVMEEAGTLVLSVPAMHCEFSCYPSIKKILEEDQAVDEVELAEQKEEGTIDNRQVIVKYESGFDVNAAIALLGDKGFKESEVVQ